MKRQLLLGLVASVLVPATASAQLNDTGVITCHNNVSAVGTVTLTTPNPEPTDFPGQDCTSGRSAADAMGFLPKVGGSSIPGRDYTKVSRSGNDLPPDAVLGPGPDDWGCTRDNVTGLLWEIKTDDGGLQDKDNSYVWYDPDPATNGGVAGSSFNSTINACTGLPQHDCNTFSYRQAVNAIALCGVDDWHLASHTEVYTSIDFRVRGGFDPDYFPEYMTRAYFTRDTNPANPNLVLSVVPGGGLPGIVHKVGLGSSIVLVGRVSE